MCQVSVCVFSYNHEKYISRTIDSILSQKTNFNFEIIVGDDFSTDLTRSILNKYQYNNPEIIVLNYNIDNLGGTKNWINTINLCKGKYVALIDGDDYFIDDLKLQKQHDLLENNKNCNLCFHSVRELQELSNTYTDINFDKNIYYTHDLIEKGWFIRTSTIMFRNNVLPQYYDDWVYNFPYRLDSIIPIFLTDNSYALYIDQVMSVWRKHDNGFSNNFKLKYYENLLQEINLVKKLDEFTFYKYNLYAKINIKRLYFYLLLETFKTRKFNFYLILKYCILSDKLILIKYLIIYLKKSIK